MINLINPSTDPYFNLALEEYLLRHKTEEYFLLWRDRPVVVVGRNQNTIEEINQDVVKSKGIAVVRRLSGGGAVYHDPGNLNFTFIINEQSQMSFDFARFTEPVIKTLQKMGIEAENTGRNDISIAGKKFSGNAQCRWKNRLLHHGTLMFDCKIEELAEVLNVNPAKISSKGVKSVRSRVTNISEHLHTPFSMEQFQAILTETVRADGFLEQDMQLSESELQAVTRLREQKYSSWAWNYGNSPAFNVQHSATYPWGTVDIRMYIVQGLVMDCKLYGDFFSDGDLMEFAQHFIGLPYEEEAINKKLASVDLQSYFPAANPGEIKRLLYDI